MQMKAQIDYVDIIDQTVLEIQRRLDDPPGFRELAERAFLSPYHFHRIFRAMVGESPAEMIRRLRLERAAIQIKATDESITSIAFDAGYATHEAFTKAFQAEFEMSPSAFRTSDRNCMGKLAPSRVHYTESGSFTRFHLIERRELEMNLSVVEFPSKRLAVIHHKGPYQDIGAAFQRLAQTAGPMGLFAKPDAMGVAVYFDDPESVPPADLHSVAGVVVSESEAIGDLTEEHLEGGKFLRAEYTGPYSGLGQAWSTLYGKDIPSGGYQIRDGACFEVYLNDCSNTPAEELRTDIYVPIQ